MADVLIFDKTRSERTEIRKYLEDAVAVLSDDSLFVSELPDRDAVALFLHNENKLDMSVMEIAETKDVSISESVRSHYDDVELFLLADASISPMEYLTPRVRASSLLLKPYGKVNIRSVMFDFVSGYYRKREKPEAEKKLVLNTKDGKQFLSFSSVYYIEIREKKLYVRLKNREYSQSGTLEGIQKMLPDCFVQCHRSYIVNTDFITGIKYSENTIYLADGIMIPLSRSYKKELKGRFQNE